jgi:hypothetical protein
MRYYLKIGGAVLMATLITLSTSAYAGVDTDSLKEYLEKTLKQ